MDFTAEEATRYARHFTLPDVGREGQERLRSASVAVIGAGGLGSPVALYLAASGVGRLGIVDFDRVDRSNLQRQVLHGTSTIGTPKLDSARARLEDLNPNVRVETHPLRLSSENALQVLGGYDIVVDGTDNFATRYLVNDACVLLGKPNVYASVFRFEGQASVFSAAEGPCYRCLYPEPPPPGLVPSCEEGGVLGVVPGLLGMIQAAEAIKLILGIGQTLVGRLLLVDLLAASFRQVRLQKNRDCVVCGDSPSIRELIDYDLFCSGAPSGEISPSELRQRKESVRLVDVRERYEWDQVRIEGATWIPLRELPMRVGELSPDEETVVYCASGIRSAHAVEFLRSRGFARARNLTGGIIRWLGEQGDAESG